MKIVAVVFLSLLIIGSLALADSPGKYSLVRIPVADRSSLSIFGKIGIDFESAMGKPGGVMEFVLDQAELQQLNAEGVSYEVITDDLAMSYQEKLTSRPFDALGFGLGSMGGYFTYIEVKRQLDSMRLLYPSLISTIDSIGSSDEGRAIWAAKISDKPTIDEPNEPEVLFTSLHHAREPAGMMTALYYMWWLLENHGIDPEATYLVNSRQVWFIPVVNPDGYVYNQTTNPSGGGLWRKNRHNNGDGTFGVDLNRNYGSFEMWNAPNGGSSTSTSSTTYRGTVPFSEKETQAIDGFMRSHNIKLCLNYHTYSRLLVVPWGYLSAESGDSLTYREFAFDLVADNRYASGTDMQTVNYSTRGNSDDYMFGDTSKPRTFAMTPEVGTSFWPPSTSILPLAMENLTANIYSTRVVGQYSRLKTYSVSDASADGFLEVGEEYTLNITLRNTGLGDVANLSATIAPPAGLQFNTSTVVLPSFAARTDTTISFDGVVEASAPLGQTLYLVITLTDPDGYVRVDSLGLVVGIPAILLDDDATGGAGNWTTGWGISPIAHTAPASFTDSPSGDYGVNTNNSLQLTNPINLDGFSAVKLEFWTKWAIEPSWDFGTVEISTDGGGTWVSQKTNLSHKGSGFGAIQPLGTWGYDGYTPGLTWSHQEIDLSSFAGSVIRIRFRIASDAGDQRDGWYVDDVRIIGYRPFSMFASMDFSDGQSGTAALTFGEMVGATDGIDSALLESELPPKPAPGTFDIRWQIFPTNGSLLDVRETLSITNPENTFTAEMQPGSSGDPITITWKPETFLEGAWHLRDGASSGALFDINMWTQNSFILSDTTVSSIQIVHTDADTVRFNVAEKWNMVAIPVGDKFIPKSTLFPGALSDAFAFKGTYEIHDTLIPQIGYWVKLPSAATIEVSGMPVVSTSRTLPNGWSLIGGLSYTTQLSSAQCSPSPCQIFTYRNGYTKPGELYPGEAFWIKGPTILQLSAIADGGMRGEPFISRSSSQDMLGSFTISDATGASGELFVGRPNSPLSGHDHYELPPPPPLGAFDARFASGKMFEVVREDRPTILPISIRSEYYPIEFAWTVGETSGSLSLQGKQLPLSGQGRIILHDPSMGEPTITFDGLPRNVPQKFQLYQNYPNPFNPRTSITFDVPTTSLISLRVIDILAEIDREVISQQLYASGRYSTSFDATGLSSGVYFYRLTVAPLNGIPPRQLTNKMLLLK